MLDREGPFTPTELARRLGIGPSTLTYRLKALEAEGTLTRRPNPADGRSAFVELSAAGRRRWKRVIPSLTETLRSAERRIALPHDEVAASLDALSAAVDEEVRVRQGKKTLARDS